MGVMIPQPISGKNRAALVYWQAKCEGRAMPSRADIDPGEMVSFLANVVLLDVSLEPLDFRYRLIGTIIDDHMTSSHTGKWMSEIPHQRQPSRIWSNCQKVVLERRPFSSDTPYIGPRKELVRAEDILMPLSDDGEVVSMILVVVDYLRREQLPPL